MNIHPLALLLWNLRNVLARWAADMTPCEDVSAMDSTSVDAGELIAAGVSFQMKNADTAFGEDGELLGYTEVGQRSKFDVEAELHLARLALEDASDDDETEAAQALLDAIDGADGDHTNRYFSASEGLADTTELSTPYWVEVADAHLAEMADAERLATPRQGDLDMMHGTMEYWAAQRAARFERLRVTAKRLAKAQNWEKLGRLKAGVAERYQTTAQLVKSRAKNEWWMLYLTSAQVSYLRSV
jgi:hypothetical protein